MPCARDLLVSREFTNVFLVVISFVLSPQEVLVQDRKFRPYLPFCPNRVCAISQCSFPCPQDLHNIFRRQLGFPGMVSPPDMARWESLASAVDEVTAPVRIAIVGKYTGLQDSYLSVIKVSNV